MRIVNHATATRSPRARRMARARRGTAMLEFALVLPIFMFLLLFTIDMGQVILMNGAMQDATYSAARAGAQVGGGGIEGRTGVVTCANGAACSSGTAARTFAQGEQQIPFRATSTRTSFRIDSGAVCKAAGTDNHVTVRTAFTVNLITPGLNGMLKMMDGKDRGSDQPWRMSTTAVARCEIVR